MLDTQKFTPEEYGRDVVHPANQDCGHYWPTNTTCPCHLAGKDSAPIPLGKDTGVGYADAIESIDGMDVGFDFTRRRAWTLSASNGRPRKTAGWSENEDKDSPGARFFGDIGNWGAWYDTAYGHGSLGAAFVTEQEAIAAVRQCFMPWPPCP